MIGGARFAAVDLGASSGRIVVCTWTGERFEEQELHRFVNRPVQMPGELCWDVLRLWEEVLEGLRWYRHLFGDDLCGISVDAWGVDFAMLDGSGRIVGNPVCYRDPRTRGIPAEVFAKVPEREWFIETGTHTMEINTLFQIAALVSRGDRRLDAAEKMLMIPDLFLYLLGGETGAEFTEASTTQMLSLSRRDWVSPLIESAGIRASFLPPVVLPGTLTSQVRSDVLRACGFARSFPVISSASHDTASAVAAIPGLDEFSVFVSCGTWSLIGVETSAPDTSERAFELGFTNEGAADGATMLLKNLTGLWITQECLRIWNLRSAALDWQRLCESAAIQRAFRSFLNPDDPRLHREGEMPELIAEYLKETGQAELDGAAAIARAAFESLALRYRSTVESLEQITGRSLTTIRMVGGGCQNRLLCQMTADATGRPLVAGPVEASALGNGMVQAVATGHINDLRVGRKAIAASIQTRTYEPAACAKWDEAYARFRLLERN